MPSRPSGRRRHHFGPHLRHETSLLRSGITHNRPGIRTNFRDGFARDSLLQRRVCEPSVPRRRKMPKSRKNTPLSCRRRQSALVLTSPSWSGFAYDFRSSVRPRIYMDRATGTALRAEAARKPALGPRFPQAGSRTIAVCRLAERQGRFDGQEKLSSVSPIGISIAQG